jgi:hypothetical protein
MTAMAGRTMKERPFTRRPSQPGLHTQRSAPIYATLVEVEGEIDLQLIWSRPNRTDPENPTPHPPSGAVRRQLRRRDKRPVSAKST